MIRSDIKICELYDNDKRLWSALTTDHLFRNRGVDMDNTIHISFRGGLSINLILILFARLLKTFRAVLYDNDNRL